MPLGVIKQPHCGLPSPPPSLHLSGFSNRHPVPVKHPLPSPTLVPGTCPSAFCLYDSGASREPPVQGLIQ